MAKPPIFNKQTIQLIIHLYEEKRLSTTEIAKKFNCHPGTLRNYLRAEGFVLERNRSTADDIKRLEHMEYLYNVLGYSFSEVGKEYGLSGEAVSGLFRRHNIPRRTPAETLSLKARQRKNIAQKERDMATDQEKISA